VVIYKRVVIVVEKLRRNIEKVSSVNISLTGRYASFVMDLIYVFIKQINIIVLFAEE